MDIKEGDSSMGHNLSGRATSSTSEEIIKQGSNTTDSQILPNENILKDKTNPERKNISKGFGLSNDSSKLLIKRPEKKVIIYLNKDQIIIPEKEGIIETEKASDSPLLNSNQKSLELQTPKTVESKKKNHYSNREIKDMFKDYSKLYNVNSYLSILYLTDPGETSDKTHSPEMIRFIQKMSQHFRDRNLPFPFQETHYIKLANITLFNMVCNYGENKKHFQRGKNINIQYRCENLEPIIFSFSTDDFLSIIDEIESEMGDFSLRKICKEANLELNILAAATRKPSYYVNHIEKSFNTKLTREEKFFCYGFNTVSFWVQEKHPTLFRLLNQDLLRFNAQSVENPFNLNVEDY